MFAISRLQIAAILALSLTGCGNSEVTSVKNATVAQDRTHTYQTALSDRASCASEEWRTFTDDKNRKAVEYRCELKGGAELMAAMYSWKLGETRSEFASYYQALDQRAEEYKQQPGTLASLAAEAKSKLAAAEATAAEQDKQFANEDPARAMRRAAVRNEMGPLASARSIAERAQQSADDSSANLERNLTSLQEEKERFRQGEQLAISRIEKSYGNVKNTTEVFQWLVKGDDVFPGWSGIELEKQDGTKITINKEWPAVIRDLVQYRGEDHVRHVLGIPNEAVSGKASTPQATQVPRERDETCYQQKLQSFRSGMGEEAPISNDMMNEWRAECGLKPI